MDINKTINKIKNSKTFQYGIASIVFGIIVYSGVSLFSGKNRNSAPANTVQNAIVPLTPKNQSGTVTDKQKNQKRILQEMKIDYQRANNPKDVYLNTQTSQNQDIETMGNYNIQVDNKIYQATLNKVKKQNIKIKKQNNKTAFPKKIKKENKPKIIALEENKKNDNEKSPLQLNILNRTTTKENIEDKIELYSEIYNYSHPLKNNGQLVVKKAYWKELSKYPQYAIKNNKNIQNTLNNNLSNNISENNKNIIKVVPGSTFFARLMIPIENIYAGDVKPIAEIINGPLKGYRIIGQATTDDSDSGLILSFSRLVSPDGSEYSIQAIGVQTKNLSPKFVDSINRHLLPKMVLATLATVADSLFNSNKNYTAPAQSILSQELQNMIQEYPTEIKVNPKYFVVIFY